MLKKPKVAIVDYRLSNLFSVQQACNRVGLDTKITSDKAYVNKADAVILPGVGAFGDAMENLDKLDLIDTIRRHIGLGKPFMGVCLGMQLLFDESEEFGYHKGLGVLPGKVRKFKPINTEKIRVPQIGWNQIYYPPKNSCRWKKTPLENINHYEFVYFVHSYYVVPKDKKVILSLTNYSGVEYCSSLCSQNVFAVQFHPEKSGKMGIRIYKTWAKQINRL